MPTLHMVQMMMRCAGCGELVSEWAARCPACHHGTDDAFEVGPPPVPNMPSDEGPDDQEEVTPDQADQMAFAEDSRPARQNRRRRPGWVVAVALVAVASVTILTLTLASAFGGHTKGSGIPALASRLPGHVIAETDNGTLLLSGPDGQKGTVLHAEPFEANDEPLLVDRNGAVVALRPDQVAGSAARIDSLFLPLPAAASIVQTDPFTDGQAAVVVTSGSAGPAFSPSISVVTLSGRRTASLGFANDAAGDPLALGAFVTVPSDRQPTGLPPWVLKGLADSQVELRDQGRPPVVLATAAQLQRDVGQDPGQPVNLRVFPDRDGRKVAVMLNRVGVGESNSPLVILSRVGQVLTAVDSAAGPAEYSTPTWSPDGTSLVYETFGGTGTSVAVLNTSNQTSGQLAAQSLEPTTSVGGCTWSPDSAWVLCAITGPTHENWLLATNDKTLTPFFSLPAQGSPAAWLPDRLASVAP